jgi:hypothetical protein
MHGLYLCSGGLSFRGLFLCILWLGFMMPGAFAAETDYPADVPEESLAEKLGFSWDLLLAGSWEKGETLISREDLRLRFSRPGLTLRTQVVDKRIFKAGSLPTREDLTGGNTAFSGGLYHTPTGSRLLYGIQDEWGLPARLRNPWARSVPFAENHKTSINDLETDPSSTKDEELYLYLKSPQLGPFTGFASVLLDGDLNPAVGGGGALRFGKKLNLGLEVFYTGRELPPRNASSWFALPPPLPARDFRLYALGLILNTPLIDLSSDWAFSETFAYGRDLYGSLGLRLKLRPWTLSLAVDGAGNRYVGRDGSAPGAGFRAGGRLERRGKRSGLFRLGISLRAPGPGEAFERGSYLVSYHFPPPSGNFPVSPSRASLSLNRNASDPEKIEDRLEGTLGLNAGPFRPALSVNLNGLTAEEGSPPAFPSPRSFGNPRSAAFSGEMSYAFKIFLIKTKLGYTARKEKGGIWDTSLNLTARKKSGRFSLKIASPEFPEKWTWEISWRLEI